MPELVKEKVSTDTPVLKHGLGSLSHVRVIAFEGLLRKETDWR